MTPSSSTLETQRARPRGLAPWWAGVLLGALCAATPVRAQHVDHPPPFNVSGAVLLGVSPYNVSYGALPDNSGLTLARYAAHLDVELWGRRLFFPMDVLMFSDATAPRFLHKLRPSELDVVAGVASGWELPLDLGEAEFGMRWEHDRPVFVPGFTQTYVDLRAQHIFSAARRFPLLADLLAGGDISGFNTVGLFVLNPSFAARPDNTGLALWRYNGHVELSVASDALSLGVDGMFFSDRTARNPLRPSELDVTAEIILRTGSVEVHLAYEEDHPLDRAGLVQRYFYAVLVLGFDLQGLHAAGARALPYEARNRMMSP